MPLVRTGDVQLYYEARGQGPTLVCIGGLGVHVGYWATVLDMLAGRHHVVVYDNRGSGRSDAPAGPYAIEQMTDDLLGLLDALEIDRPILLGHSMGGYIALRAAARHPERVQALVLYSTSAIMNWPAARFIESVEKVWTECPGISSGALTRIFIPWSWSPHRLADGAQMEMLVQLAEMNPYKQTVDAFRAQVDACRSFDGLPLLPRITAPTLVMGGSHDLIAPLVNQQHLTERIKGARLVVCDAGHNAHLEEPEWFVEQVLAFTAG